MSQWKVLIRDKITKVTDKTHKCTIVLADSYTTLCQWVASFIKLQVQKDVLSQGTMVTEACFLAPPAERQRSFSNAELPVVCRRLSSSVVVRRRRLVRPSVLLYFYMKLPKEEDCQKVNSERSENLVCWSLTSLCHSNGHIETMPAR